jgi:hypothetical protein
VVALQADDAAKASTSAARAAVGWASVKADVRGLSLVFIIDVGLDEMSAQTITVFASSKTVAGFPTSNGLVATSYY